MDRSGSNRRSNGGRRRLGPGRVAALVLAGTLWLCAPAHADDEADRILAAAHRRMGGARVDALHGLRARAEVAGPKSEFTTTLWSMRDGRARMEQHPPGFVGLSRLDGGWTFEDGAETLQPIDSLTAGFVHGHELHWTVLAPRSRLQDFEFRGSGRFRDRDALVVAARDRFGNPVELFYGREDSLPLGMRVQNRIDVHLDDWKHRHGLYVFERAAFFDGDDVYRYHYSDIKSLEAGDPEVERSPLRRGAAFRPRAASGLAALVDPKIGTGGTGHTFPGAAWPFGMVQLSPDTRLEGWEGCSGYWYPELYIHGFSHTHLSGTGVGDYCDILLMPRTGVPQFGDIRSAFVHQEEWASPGYYAVRLQDTGIVAELTVTPRTGLHRYRFPGDGSGHVILDLAHRDEVLDSRIEIVSDSEVSGFRRSRGWAQDQHVYFVARFSRPVRATTQDRRAAFECGAGPPLLVKIGISAVSEAGARRNLDAEQPGWDFDAVRDRAERAWERELDRIRIEGGTKSQRRTFYTALYHLFLQPNLYSDVDGQYRGRDLQVHTAREGNHYTVFSLWDTFRAAHPLYTLLDFERTRDFTRTFLRQYDEGGALPVWELAANETNCMIGYHAVPVLAEAILKGIPGVDAPRAFEAMLASARADRRGLPDYRRRGFIPAEEEGESVSQTLEYAYDDACIAKVAAFLGRRDEQAEFERRAQSYAHLFDPTTGFMRARLHGHWFTPFDPAEVNFHYTEANAWQYSFFVPQDVDGLMWLHGGREAFAAKLDAMFAADSRLRGTQQADITGLIGQYAHGNEPSHHMAYLYVHAGQPWKTQSLVRRICNDLYADRPDGLPGNEDCGQMSAWYVWSALGLYPVDPASGDYVLGSPLFPRATVRLGNDKRFVIRAEGDVAAHAYVQSARLQGRRLERAWVGWDEITRGGELVFMMGPEPALGWGSSAKDAPISRTTDAANVLVPAPYVARGERLFVGTTEVVLACADPAARIAYSRDGRETYADTPGSCTIRLDHTTHVVAVAIRGTAKSPVVDLHFFARDPNRHVQLGSRYTPRYGAGGDDALLDGLRGRANFRLGAWQGFQGQDLDATIDLGREVEMRGLALGCLQDTRSWIVYPARVEFEVSEDGTRFEKVGVATHDIPDRDLEVQTRDLAVAFTPRKARYIRLHAQSYGPLPDWHPGKGSPSFIFADELVIQE